ncbi:MAG: hypothetical protein H8E05_01320 [Bacteroidetes bacterium]|nr:hypothetical protein [Bacteroidota bacterium]
MSRPVTVDYHRKEALLRIAKAVVRASENRYLPPKDGYPTDEQGERALKLLRDSLPSKVKTRYNQRDIKKRKYKNAK